MIFRSGSRLRLVAVFSIVLLCTIYYLFSPLSWPYDSRADEAHTDETLIDKGLAFPGADQLEDVALAMSHSPALITPDPESFCVNRFGINYLLNFSKFATEYCDENSSASLTCFTNKIHNGRMDSFCIASPAGLDLANSQIRLGCKIKNLTQDESTRHAVGLDKFPRYWHNTGPRVVIDRFVNFEDDDAHQLGNAVASTTKRVLLLVQREGPDLVTNLWHTLMQIMSSSLSLDILRATIDVRTGRPFFSQQDFEMSQVVILDDHEDGPFWELWNMLASLPTIRFKELPGDLDSSKLVFPLPGGSNPMWQGAWLDLPCNESLLIRNFAQQTLEDYQVHQHPGRYTWLSPLRITFIDRRGSRKLVNQTSLFDTLWARHPGLVVQLIDFAELSFKEQLQTVRYTDILVGVHGAGLTHAMFLAPNSTLVEILPASLDHKGFKNMAKFFDVEYLATHADEVNPGGIGNDWQYDDVIIPEERFMALMEEAMNRTAASLSQPWLVDPSLLHRKKTSSTNAK